MTALQTDIERRLAIPEPDVEVLLVEVTSHSSHPTMRIFIDHPEGVTLEICERVSHRLSQLRERYALEVSSPGPERPLTKPEHFRRYLGRRARVRRHGSDGDCHGSKRSVTGELVGATDTQVTLAAADGVMAIPYSEIRRSNLVEE